MFQFILENNNPDKMFTQSLSKLANSERHDSNKSLFYHTVAKKVMFKSSQKYSLLYHIVAKKVMLESSQKYSLFSALYLVLEDAKQNRATSI